MDIDSAEKTPKRVTFKKIISILIVFSIFILFTIYSWLCSWNIALGYIGLAIIIIGAVLWRKKTINYLFSSWVILFLLTLFLFIPSLKCYNEKTIDYMHRIDKGENLTFKEKVSIYGLNIFMSIAAYPIYPEVSKESFYLLFKSDTGERTFESDFFMKSQEIKKGFNNKTKEVKWSSSKYNMGNPESRYALALNPCYLSYTETNTYKEYTVSVKVEYPKKTSAVLLKQPIKIVVEEGLFNYLQKEKWLHPYTAIWKTTILK
jgi:hypothetical protein